MQHEEGTPALAVALTTFAGLATGLGGVIVVWGGKPEAFSYKTMGKPISPAVGRFKTSP